MIAENIRPLAIGVIEHDGKIFVAEGYDPHKQQTFYRPLGGAIEFGEYGQEALIREFSEEIGENIRVTGYLGTLENLFMYNGQTGHELVRVYKVVFEDPVMYECSLVEAHEDDGSPFRALWRPLNDFITRNAILYPDGLLELLMKSQYSVHGFLIQATDMGIRFMRDDLQDYQLMHKWLSDRRIQAFYDQGEVSATMESVIRQYRPCIYRHNATVPCFLIYQGLPIGYIEYRDDINMDHLGIVSPGPVYSIDMFIGETGYWNRGLGFHAVSLMVAYLFDKLHAAKVIVSPYSDNTRSIKIYEKCGFRPMHITPRRNGNSNSSPESLLMAIDNPRRLEGNLTGR
jgi:aminoglycoside 6'-N-acetyltransferase